jgi:hypothetical protein
MGEWWLSNRMQEEFMKTSRNKTVLPAIALMIMSAGISLAQTGLQQGDGDKKATTLPNKKGQKYLDQEMLKSELSGRKDEPHYVMAMAYLQSLGTFAKALGDQASGDSQLSADFARAAVNEMNRSLDKAEEHLREHLKTISPDIRSRLAATMKEMDAQRSKLSGAVNALEKDVQNYTLDPKQIAADSATILKHLDELSKRHNGN